MAIRFGDAVKAYQEGADWRRKRNDDSVDSALKQAQLQEAGYSYDGRTLTRDPGYVSTKALERKIKESEYEDLIDPSRAAKREATKFGAVLSELDKHQGGFGQPEPTSDIDAQIEALKAELVKNRESKGTKEKTTMDDPLGVLS